MSADRVEASEENPSQLSQLLISCSISNEAGDLRQFEICVSELTKFLNSVSDEIASEEENQASENQAFEVLAAIRSYVTSPSLDQAVIDGLSFELPKAVARFACVSQRCMEIAESVIDCFIGACSPRDMLMILCEALDSPSTMSTTPSYFTPLLTALKKAFVSIQRRHFELIKAALPVILNVFKVVDSDMDDGDTDSIDLFDRAIDIADAIKEISGKVDGRVNEKLHALLGLFLLQIIALASIAIGDRASKYLPMMLRLSRFLPHCRLSYCGLITGNDVDTVMSVVFGDDEDDYMSCYSHVKLGASLAVIWGYMFDDVAQAAKEKIDDVKYELQSNQMKRWQAQGMLKHIFSCVELSWESNKHAINFLLCILDGEVSSNCTTNEQMDYMPSLFAAMQAVGMIIMYAPDVSLRKKAFDALKKFLADVPSSMRFSILKALIRNSDSSSMIAILVDCFRQELWKENCNGTGNNGKGLPAKDEEEHQNNIFWSAGGVIELVELILRPPKGGPPLLPDYGDAVLSALNLYRFVLITESTRKTNLSGVRSKTNLEKAYNDWFLPLRTLVTGIIKAENDDNNDEHLHVVCALNPIELVLYRCIELVEENLKFST